MSTSDISKTQKLADLKAKVYSRTILPNAQMRARSFSMALLANIQECKLVKIKKTLKNLFSRYKLSISQGSFKHHNHAFYITKSYKRM